MKYLEKIHWILDEGSSGLKDDSLYKDNIAFVHGLGLKCDCVGWARLTLTGNPRADEILDKIEAYCKANGRTARCCYERSFLDVESDWYELLPTSFQIDTVCGYTDVPADNGRSISLCNIKAYMETSATIKKWSEIYVPERFYRACRTHNIPGIHFCWTKDGGRFQAEQYFSVWCDTQIPHLGLASAIKTRKPSILEAAGGWLPRIGKVFHDLQFVTYPPCFLSSDLPDGGFAYAKLPERKHHTREYIVLVHKDTLKLLLEEKAISSGAFRPALVVDTPTGEYLLEDTIHQPHPTDAWISQSFQDYEKLMTKPRPQRKVTEKQALSRLRLQKRQRKEDFQKAWPQINAEEVASSAWKILLPYYLVANGGFLSNEYELLSYETAREETEEFFAAMAAEELAENPPQGVVIGRCPDGDTILYCMDGTVARFSHEEPIVSQQWPTLPQFIAEALEENE